MSAAPAGGDAGPPLVGPRRPLVGPRPVRRSRGRWVAAGVLPVGVLLVAVWPGTSDGASGPGSAGSASSSSAAPGPEEIAAPVTADEGQG